MCKARTGIVALTFLSILVVLGGFSNVAAGGDAYGKPLTGTETISISALLDDPDPHLGEVVRVEGLVTGVCEKRGCWMSLAADDDEFKEIRIKVDDGVIVFPMEAKGRRAVAEGVLSKIEMSMEETLAYSEHHAKEHGEEFDPSEVTEPLVFYQIKGTGAVIH
jgi:hypothetical protein